MKSTSKKIRDRKDALSELRALLGRVRSKGYKVDDRKRASIFRAGLQTVLMTARVHRGKASAGEFFAELATLTQIDVRRFEHQPVGHDYLLQLLQGEPLPIDEEVRWIATRLKSESIRLNDFLKLFYEMEIAFCTSDYERCEILLNSCEETHGTSLWSTELKLGLIQVRRGLEAQKAVVKEVRAVRRVGVWPYVAHTASVRAEPSVSISWFLEETRRRQDRQKTNELSAYLKYRGLGRWPEANSACSRVLRVEQNHHVIDLYETFVSYLQEASTRKYPDALKSAFAFALEEIKGIEDVRLTKLRFAFMGTASTSIPFDDLALINLLLDASNEKVPSAELRAKFRLPMSPERVFSLALAAKRTTLAPSATSSPRMIAVRGLSQGLHRKGFQSSTAGRADEKLTKFAHMFGALSFARSIRSILDAAAAPQTAQAVRLLQVAALNSPIWGALDLIGFASHSAYEQLKSLAPA